MSTVTFPVKPDSNDLAEQRTDFALERTIMAADRTLMAWIRTAMSMIGFGFTLYKFLQYMRQENMTPVLRLQGPRNLGLAFIGVGIFSLSIACIQNWHFMKQCCDHHRRKSFNLSLAVAVIVALIGIFAFMNVLFRIGPF